MAEKLIYNRGELPEILCESHPEWVELYDRAWQIAFKNMEYSDREGWLPQMTCMPGVGILWQWDSCFMTLLDSRDQEEIRIILLFPNDCVAEEQHYAFDQ